MRRHTVAVVGAGLAGLAAARRLVAAGCDVRLLERGPAPGGRAWSTRFDGFTLEPGGALLSTGDRELLAWIDSVGLGEALPLRPVVEARFQRGRLRTIDPRHALGVARIPGIRPHQALRLPRLARLLRRYAAHLDPRAPERAAPLDDRSLADFGRLYFGESVLAHWLAPAVAAGALGGAQETSRALFLLEQRARGRARAGLLRASLGELAEAAATGLALDCGVECTRVESARSVERAEPTAPDPSGGTGRLALTLRGARGDRLEVDAALLAVPADDAARLAAPLLAPAERDALAGVRYAPRIAVALALRRAFGPHPQLVRIGEPADSALESLLFEPGVAGGRVPPGRGLVTLRASARWSESHRAVPDETLEKELVSAFERVQPNAGAAVLFARVFRVARALPRFDVGHYRRLARFEAVQRDRCAAGRRLYFAGDWRMEPGWHGAWASGRRAAESLLHDLGA